MTDEPFGRQSKPVRVMFEGDPQDVRYWLGVLAARAEFKGDAVVRLDVQQCFTIYPRAVNE